MLRKAQPIRAGKGQRALLDTVLRPTVGKSEEGPTKIKKRHMKREGGPAKIEKGSIKIEKGPAKIEKGRVKVNQRPTDIRNGTGRAPMIKSEDKNKVGSLKKVKLEEQPTKVIDERGAADVIALKSEVVAANALAALAERSRKQQEMELERRQKVHDRILKTEQSKVLKLVQQLVCRSPTNISPVD